jgi:hypothetical protein
MVTKPFRRAACILGLLIILLAGCSSKPISVSLSAPVEEKVGYEEIEIKNCNCPDDISEPLGDKVSLEKTITFLSQGSGEAPSSCRPISEELNQEIVELIDQQCSQYYQQAEEELQAINLEVPFDRIRIFRIEWRARTYQSTVSLNISGRPCTASYAYTVKVPYLLGHSTEPCTS